MTKGLAPREIEYWAATPFALELRSSGNGSRKIARSVAMRQPSIAKATTSVVSGRLLKIGHSQRAPQTNSPASLADMSTGSCWEPRQPERCNFKSTLAVWITQLTSRVYVRIF
jgi:hypothetical protein